MFVSLSFFLDKVQLSIIRARVEGLLDRRKSLGYVSVLTCERTSVASATHTHTQTTAIREEYRITVAHRNKHVFNGVDQTLKHLTVMVPVKPTPLIVVTESISFCMLSVFAPFFSEAMLSTISSTDVLFSTR